MNSFQFNILPNGAVIAERYKVLECLGAGSMATVYKCEDRQLPGLILAIKVLHPRIANDPDITERFRQEIVHSYLVNHPNVNRTFDIIASDDVVAFTMEYVSGGDLSRLIDQEPPIALSEIIDTLCQICRGVQAIHEAGIVHRDLKPENILLAADGTIKIVDFGIASAEEGRKITKHEGVMGTLSYVSPEYLAKGQLDKRSDIYALGVIAYELVSGVRPFEAPSIIESMRKKVLTEPEPPHAFRIDCPTELSEVILKAMARDPEERYQDITDMYEALREVKAALGKERKVILLDRISQDKVVVKRVSDNGHGKFDDEFTPEIYRPSVDLFRYCDAAPLNDNAFRLKRLREKKIRSSFRHPYKRGRGLLASASMIGAAMVLFAGSIAGYQNLEAFANVREYLSGNSFLSAQSGASDEQENIEPSWGKIARARLSLEGVLGDIAAQAGLGGSPETTSPEADSILVQSELLPENSAESEPISEGSEIPVVSSQSGEFAGPVKEVDLNMENQVKAALVFKLMDSARWRNKSAPADNSTLRLCVVGGDTFGDLLERMAASRKLKSGRSVLFERIQALNTDSVQSCNVAFLASDADKISEPIAKALREAHVLTVSEDRGDGMVRLALEKDLIFMKINHDEAKLSGIELR